MATDLPRATVRLLAPPERSRAVEIADACFRENRFYRGALGLDRAGLIVYWDELFRLALGDPRARAFGLYLSGSLHGVLLVSLEGFPSPRRGACFLARLFARLGPRRIARYLAFVREYDRAITALEHDRAREARCLWLMIAPRAGARFGPLLIRETRAALHEEGKPVSVALIDAGDPRIVHFYRRVGFRISPPFPFCGGSASTIEIANGPAGGHA